MKHFTRRLKQYQLKSYLLKKAVILGLQLTERVNIKNNK